MSTRCLIGIQRGNRVQYSYCHHDGYLDWVGKVLTKCYDTEPKITELLSFGDMPSLGARLELNPHYSGRLDDIENSGCEFYERDRGERGTYLHRPEVDADKYDFRCQSDADYIYLFKDNEWYVLTAYAEDFEKVSDLLAKRNKEDN